MQTFRQRQHVKELVFLETGERLECLVIQDLNSSMKLGFIGPELYAQIEWMPHESRLQEIDRSPLFKAILKVEFAKRDYFAVSSLTFTLTDGSLVTGKTDREFAEWLVPEFQRSKVA